MVEWCISVHTLVKINMLLADQKNKNMLLNCDQVKHNLEELSLIFEVVRNAWSLNERLQSEMT